MYDPVIDYDSENQKFSVGKQLKLKNYSFSSNSRFRNLINLKNQTIIEEDIFVCGFNNSSIFYNSKSNEKRLICSDIKNIVCGIFHDGILYLADDSGRLIKYSLISNSTIKNEHICSQRISDMQLIEITGKKNSLCCGAWDGKLYIIDCDDLRIESIFTYPLMNHAVCSAHFNDNTIVCGSQLGHLIIFKDNVVIETIENAHKDIIRQIINLKNTNYLITCSNDGFIKIWNVKTSSNVFSLHVDDSFLYSLDAVHTISGQTIYIQILSSGEKGEVYLINLNFDMNNNNISTVESNLKVVWSHDSNIWGIKNINGDFFVCTDNGTILCFSYTEHMIEEKLIEYTNQIKKNIISANSTNGKIDPSKLHLYRDRDNYRGKKENVIAMFRDDEENDIKICSWNNNQWVLIGAQIETKSDSKTYYEGDKTFAAGLYDYVIKVDIGNSSKKMFDLPFNDGQDFTDVATKFCLQNKLSLENINTIVKFLQKNTNPNYNNDIFDQIEQAPTVFEDKKIQQKQPFLFISPTNLHAGWDKLKSNEEIINKLKKIEISRIDDFINMFDRINNDKNYLNRLQPKESFIHFIFDTTNSWTTIGRQNYLFFIDIMRILSANVDVYKLVVKNYKLIKIIQFLFDLIILNEGKLTTLALKVICNLSSHEHSRNIIKVFFVKKNISVSFFDNDVDLVIYKKIENNLSLKT